MRVLLVAAGGLAREALAALAAAGTHEVAGLLDDDESLRGGEVGGVPVLGGLDRVGDHPDAQLLVCAGRGAVRERLVARLERVGAGAERFATLVHPSVAVPSSCRVGRGSVVLAGAVLTADVTLGEHVVVMPGAVLTHDDVVADYATLAAHAVLGGGVRIGARAYLGMSCSIRQHVQVGADAVVGMGAAVLADVGPGETWVGVPARRLRPDGGDR